MPNMQTLHLYNSLTRKKEPFTPIDSTRVTMYNCGPTVYSYAHIGNARAAVAADVLFRVLRYIYGEEHVVYARNITDVDDKIIKAAAEQNVPISEITEKFARIYNEDLAALGCLPPTHQPKATENIGGMIAIIEKLLADDFAYESDGHVFFDVSKYDDYGKLSGNTLDALKKGDRVGEGEVARKKNAADFVLWKPEDGGVGWDAPFGRGRPGWHIECSAMAKEVLCDEEYGETIDIHCGGIDLKFPHHENEIAQSNCAHGKPMAKYWVHNEFLNMGKDKMSKSLGNVVLVHDLLEQWDGEVIRLALLKAHYRSELIWSEDLLRESKDTLDTWYRKLAEYNRLKALAGNNGPRPSLHDLLADLNTPEFFAKIESWAETIIWQQPENTKAAMQEDWNYFVDLYSMVIPIQFIGLLQKDPEEWFRGKSKEGGLTDVQIDALIAERADVRAAKNWARADEIRDIFAAENIILEDSKASTTWRRG